MNRLSSFLIRVGLAWVLFYPAVNGFINPAPWLPFIPRFLIDFFPAQPMLVFFLVFQIILAFWLLSGRYVLYSGLVVFFYLLAVFVMNFDNLGTIFRDVPLIFVSLALALSERKGE